MFTVLKKDVTMIGDMSNMEAEYIDEGKGWRLSKLNRINKRTKETFEVECTPNSNSYDKYCDADINFTVGGVKYRRILNINLRNNIEYVSQDIITSEEEHDMSEDFVSLWKNTKLKKKDIMICFLNYIIKRKKIKS